MSGPRPLDCDIKSTNLNDIMHRGVVEKMMVRPTHSPEDRETDLSLVRQSAKGTDQLIVSWTAC